MRYELVEQSIFDNKERIALTMEEAVHKLNNKTEEIKIMQRKIDKLEELLMLRKIDRDYDYKQRTR